MEASSTNTTKEEAPLSQRYKNIATIGNGTFGIVYMVLFPNIPGLRYHESLEIKSGRQTRPSK